MTSGGPAAADPTGRSPLDRAQFAAADGLRSGGYVLADAPGGKPELILIATGSEVALIVAAREQLLARKIAVRIVSLPSWALFDAQPQEYRNSVLPRSIGARLAVEAGVVQGWHRYVGERGDVLGVEGFGASAPGNILLREYGFTSTTSVHARWRFWVDDETRV